MAKESVYDRFGNTTNPLSFREKLSVLPDYTLFKLRSSGIITNKLPEAVVGGLIGIGTRLATREAITAAGLANLPAAVVAGAVVGAGISAVRQYQKDSQDIPSIMPISQTTIFNVPKNVYESQYKNRRDIRVTRTLPSGEVVLQQRESRLNTLSRRFRNIGHRLNVIGARRLAIAAGTGAIAGGLGALVGYSVTEAIVQLPWRELSQEATLPNWQLPDWRLPDINVPTIDLPEIDLPGIDLPFIDGEQPTPAPTPEPTPPTVHVPVPEPTPTPPLTPEPTPIPPPEQTPPIPETITIPQGSTIWEQISNVLQQEFGRPPTDYEVDYVVDEFLATHPEVNPRMIMPGTTFSIENLHDEIEWLEQRAIRGGK